MPQVLFLIDYILPYILILLLTTSINHFTIRIYIRREMAKISGIKANRSECRKRGPISRNMSLSNQTPTRRTSRTLTPYNCIDYSGLVLVPDNIRIVEIECITKLDHEDGSGQNISELYEGVKEKIVDQRQEPQTTVLDWLIATCGYFLQGVTSEFSAFMDEGLTAYKSSLDVDEYLCRPESQMSPRESRQGKKMKLEEKFQKFLIEEVEVFQNLQLNEGDLQGLNNHKIHKGIGPPRVAASIADHIKPDFLCGHSDPQSTFSIPPEIWDQIPESLRKLTPGAKRTTDSLFLPFLALELKWRGTSERVVQQQLARCLSILAERQAELEGLSDSVSTMPIFGLTGVERKFALWVMFRYVTDDTKVHYDMCELASYNLTRADDMENFRAAMTNIHDWVDNERKMHFTNCIASINQNLVMRHAFRFVSRLIPRYFI
ncbi:hypothetical protein TWF281_003983 [Arthrobotrys megalospora]